MADIVDQAFEGLLQSFSTKDQPEHFFKALLRIQHIRAYVRDSDQLDAHAAIDRLISKVASVYRVESTLYQSLSRFKAAERNNDRIMDVTTILRDYALQNASIFEERGRGLGFFDSFKRMLAPRPAGTGDSLHKALAAAEGKPACTFCATILGKVFTNHNYSECRNRQNPALLERLVRAFITCLSSLQHDTVMTFPFDWWTSWFCQFLGIAIPALNGPHRLCNCGRFVLDALGDHSHTCSQHSGSTKDAHEHILSALEKVVKRAGFTTRRKHVTSSRGGQKGDLQIRNINLAGTSDLIIDVALVHDYSGDCRRDVHRNGQLRHADPDTLLNNAADGKVRKYREAYAAPDRLLAFLPAIMSTSGRIHGEFLRLLHILSHRQAVNFFELFGEEPTDNAFTFRRAAYFFHNRATIGLACAQATAMRTHVAPHTIRHPRAPPPPHAYDPLLLLPAPARAS